MHGKGREYTDELVIPTIGASRWGRRKFPFISADLSPAGITPIFVNGHESKIKYQRSKVKMTTQNVKPFNFCSVFLHFYFYLLHFI